MDLPLWMRIAAITRLKGLHLHMAAYYLPNFVVWYDDEPTARSRSS